MPSFYLGSAGPDEVALVVTLLVAALTALYFAIQIPPMAEYQADDTDEDRREPR